MWPGTAGAVPPVSEKPLAIRATSVLGVAMIRSILIPISEGPLSSVTRDYAYWLARKEGSLISALAVIDVKAFEIPVLGTPDGFMPRWSHRRLRKASL